MSTLSRLVRNTLFSSVAFFVIGVVGIVLVPVLINAYGLAAFGLIAIGRALLPTGALAALDFGISEVATHAVGRSRGSGAWASASEQLTLLLLVSSALGATLGVTVMFLAPSLATLFRADASVQANFIAMIQVTGASLVILFPALVVDGVLRGFERFGLLRLWEVVSVLAYAIAAVCLIWWHFSYEWIQYAFVAALVMKYGALSMSAIVTARAAGLRLRPWKAVTAAQVRRLSFLVFQSKLTSTLQHQAPPLLVGALVGPAGVGVYDVVTRLPRFLKPVLSLLASSIIPVSARFVGAGDTERVRRIGATSFWLVPLLIFPPLLGAMLLSKPILVIWVGEEFGRYWPWLALMLLVPTLQGLLTIGQAAMSIHPEFIRRANRVAISGVLIQYIFSFSFVFLLEERSFILGQAIAMAVTFPVAVHQLVDASGMSNSKVVWHIAKPLLPGLALAGLTVPIIRLVADHAIVANVGLLTTWCGIYWFLCYRFVLDNDQRSFVWRLGAIVGARP